MSKGRFDNIVDCINNIKNLSKFYKPASPAWVLIQAAYGHINSIYHLEVETSFDKETLGVKDE